MHFRSAAPYEPDLGSLGVRRDEVEQALGFLQQRRRVRLRQRSELGDEQRRALKRPGAANEPVDEEGRTHDRPAGHHPFAAIMRRVVDADTHSLTLRLAGTFSPTEELYRDSKKAQDLNVQLFERTKTAGALRPDLEVDDLSLLFEQLATVRIGDEERTRQLRRRYLALLLDALRVPSGCAFAPGTLRSDQLV
jgi:hypothetical protein